MEKGISQESEKAIEADMQTVRMRMIQDKSGGTDWHQTMEGVLGHFQDFGLYPKRYGMLLGVEVVAQQRQFSILRSLVV